MLLLLLRVAGVGLLAWASLAAATWQPAFFLVPFLVAWMMRACAPGLGPERWAIPLLNGLLAWLVATPTDPGTLPVRDFLNHGLVNQHLASWHDWLWAWSVLAGAAVLKLPARWLRPMAGWVLGLVIAGFLLQSALLNPGFFLGMAQDSGKGITYNDNSTYRQVYHRVVAGQAYYPAYIESFMLLRPPTDSTPHLRLWLSLAGQFPDLEVSDRGLPSWGSNPVPGSVRGVDGRGVVGRVCAGLNPRRQSWHPFCWGRS